MCPLKLMFQVLATFCRSQGESRSERRPPSTSVEVVCVWGGPGRLGTIWSLSPWVTVA